jgi:hypothetical protein
MFSGHKVLWFTISGLLILYIVFPSGLSTGDSWYYAASVKYGNEIFQSHHLLYNALGVIFSWLPSKTGFEIISILKVMNALFAFMILFVIQKILYVLKCTDKQVVIIACLTGFSFSIIRYATENETYIVPLFFALLASYNYLKFITKGGDRYPFYAGLWAAVSILFHQVYVFWWLGLLTGFVLEGKKKHALQYLLISLIAPLAYLIVVMTSLGGLNWNNIIAFISGDLGGNVGFGITGKGLFLSFANLVRSFIQVHGYISNMLKQSILLIIPGIISIFFFVFAFLKFPKIQKAGISNRFATIHIIILALQLIFAISSFGNAEFMVMIPPLVFILIPLLTLNYETFLTRILFGMVIWNISYGIIPLHFKGQGPEQFLCDIAKSGEGAIIIVSDEQLIRSMLYYQTGEISFNSIYKSPAVLKLIEKDRSYLDTAISDAIKRGYEVYTNCLDEKTMSRSTIMEGSENEDYFSKYETILAKSWHPITGTRSVYSIKEKIKTR